MSRPYLVAMVLALVVLGVLVELLRRRRLREKFAALWIGLAVVMVVFAVVPGLLANASAWLGFRVPANLLFIVGGIVLTTISVQLSAEIGRLESETQRLAEELALIRLELDRRDSGDGPPASGPQR